MDILLYVDELRQDNSVGSTTDPEKIRYNLNLIDPTEFNKFNQRLNNDGESSTIGTAGRYIFILTASKKNNSWELIFSDCSNEENSAATVCQNLTTEMKNVFMSQFRKLRPVYDQNRFAVKLVAGSPPPVKS